MSSAVDPRIVTGLRAQSAQRERLLAAGARRLGWKAGFGTTAAMDKLATHTPLVGFLTDRTLLADGAACAIGGWSKPTLEAEVAVRLGRDLEPGADRDTAAAAVDGVAVAIELVDLADEDDVAAILAGNIFHRAVVLGEFSSDQTLEDIRLDLCGHDRLLIERADPRDLLGDLADVVRHLADQVAITGTLLQAGDVVITGAGVPAHPVVAGERYDVRAPDLGSVSVALTA